MFGVCKPVAIVEGGVINLLSYLLSPAVVSAVCSPQATDGVTQELQHGAFNER